jgi:hypothetical protein
MRKLDLQKKKARLNNYREANLTRLKNGLEKAKEPAYKKHKNQGSYAMDTIIQHPQNDYDIDVGIMFDREELKGERGADKSALCTRQMVCDAMQDDKFETPPKCLKNCVRVYYKEGHHVDMPVYRTYVEDGKFKQELASCDWEDSDPEAINKWFKKAVEKSPDTDNGRQMRRITRLIKKWAKSRASWKMPSGFIISVLVDEKYIAQKDRDDDSLYSTLKSIRGRLSNDKDIYNPVNDSLLISEGKESQLDKMYEALNFYLENTLSILDDDDCTDSSALKAWSEFFRDDFFKEKIKKAEKSACESAAIISPQKPWLLN